MFFEHTSLGKQYSTSLSLDIHMYAVTSFDIQGAHVKNSVTSSKVNLTLAFDSFSTKAK